MLLIDQSIKRVRSYRYARKWSRLRLAKESGLRESTLRYLDHPEWSPTARILRRLEAVVPHDWSSADENVGVQQEEKPVNL